VELSFVTLGARDLRALRAFYANWGWRERPGGDDEFAAFDAGGVRLALYPIDRLGAEAAPGERIPAMAWNGVTLAINVASAEEVDRAHDHALACGAAMIGAPTAREWGGYTGYVADPEGNRWEIAWAPEQ
jgi:uncharacterized glyoxalase superfamily protein PhnB